ncbi:MAG: hypothetical protein QNK37_01825 [Acidobacteriota bacterium]|nr:hypothetical protein [Acidobacteriota bacterium]
MRPDRIFFCGVRLGESDSFDCYARPPMGLNEYFETSTAETEAAPDNFSRDVVAGIDPLNLEEAGWGVIVHEQDKELLDHLSPLLRLREEQMGRKVFTHIYRGETAEQFLNEHDAPLSEADPDQVPYYLLLVGDPTSIPFSFQADLGTGYAVGRICFRDISGYTCYAKNVVRHEEAALRKRELALFGVNNNDALTQLSIEHLMTPLEKRLQKHRGRTRADWQLATIQNEDATSNRLKNLVIDSSGPALLFTASHGVAAGETEREKRALMGGLICSDWQVGQAARPEDCFLGVDRSEDADMTGLINFHFACFTAGTQKPYFGKDAQGRPKQVHMKEPFISNLAQTVLGHPRGAPAVVGHLDEAFEYSFLWQSKVNHVSHFASTLSKLVEGVPIGHAMEHFSRRYFSLATMRIDWGSPKEEAVFKYRSLQDARCYMILGDPAVRVAK